MKLDPFNLAPLTDAQGRLRRDFSDFARLWQETKEDWRDERCRRFEKEHLSSLGPSLGRLSSTLAEFSEWIRQCQSAVDDTDRGSGELY